MTPLDPAIVSFVREMAASQTYRDLLRRWLIELIGVNTAPGADLSATARAEAALRDRILACLQEAGVGPLHTEIAPIPGGIDRDPDYSLPGYAIRPDGTIPPAAEIYAERANLFVFAGTSGEARPAVILHAHTDVVPPWFEAREEDGRIYGRGACDNKGQVAVLIAQARLLRELQERFPDLRLGPRLYQFTLDEEIGGNGSVAAAADLRFTGIPVLIHECTDLVPYSAHRGCVYYRCELSAGPNPDMSPLELFPFVVLSLEALGRKLQRETNHPGFGSQHVQTSHGVFGPYGQHPGSVCDHVAIEIGVEANAHSDRLAMKLTQYLDEALVEYIARYDDRLQTGAAAGDPRAGMHFDVQPLPFDNGPRVRVDIYGRSGHMAASDDCDNAITKAAVLFGALLKNSHKFPTLRAHVRFADGPPGDATGTIVLEGGQGFTPSHSMDEVRSRMTQAATEGARKYCQLRRRKFEPDMVRMSFDRLHNDAYAQSPESPPMAALRAACAALGHPLDPPGAWVTSCDARIYHHKGYPVAIFGAGRLEAAHSDHEYVDLDDLQKALAISTLATLQLAAQAPV